MSKQLYVCDGAYGVVQSPVVCQSVGNARDTCRLVQIPDKCPQGSVDISAERNMKTFQ